MEHQCPLDSFPLIRRLVRALREAGYLYESEEW